MSDPNNSTLEPQERTDALVMAALMRATVRVLGAWSLGTSLLALGALAFTQPTTGWLLMPWWAVVALGVLERYLALRLSLDQGLFERLGCGQVADESSLDVGLAHADLRARPATARPWRDRILGARGLHRQYLLVVVLQAVALFFSIWMELLS